MSTIKKIEVVDHDKKNHPCHTIPVSKRSNNKRKRKRSKSTPSTYATNMPPVSNTNEFAT